MKKKIKYKDIYSKFSFCKEHDIELMNIFRESCGDSNTFLAIPDILFKEVAEFSNFLHFQNPSINARYFLKTFGGSTESINWAKKIIEKDKCGDPSYAACLLIIDNIIDDFKWFQEVVENSVSGDPSYSVSEYFSNTRENIDWVKKIIQNDKVGDPSWAAYFMSRHDNLSREWAEKIIEQDNSKKQEEKERVARCMVRDRGSSKEWYRMLSGKEYEEKNNKNVTS